LLGCIALFVWGGRIQPGSVFAGLAGFIAALKSKLFGSEKGSEKIAFIQRSHKLKLEGWEQEKQQYEQRYEFLKTRIDRLNNRIELLNEQLDKTSKPNYKAQHRSEEEILRWLKNN
jgi:hypothetical protein